MRNVLDIVLLGAVALYLARLRNRRSGGAVAASPRDRPEPSSTMRRLPDPPRPARAAGTASAPKQPASAHPRAYLLGDRCGGGATDRTAIMLEMMSGPGVCTPRVR